MRQNSFQFVVPDVLMTTERMDDLARIARQAAINSVLEALPDTAVRFVDRDTMLRAYSHAHIGVNTAPQSLQHFLPPNDPPRGGMWQGVAESVSRMGERLMGRSTTRPPQTLNCRSTRADLDNDGFFDRVRATEGALSITPERVAHDMAQLGEALLNTDLADAQARAVASFLGNHTHASFLGNHTHIAGGGVDAQPTAAPSLTTEKQADRLYRISSKRKRQVVDTPAELIGSPNARRDSSSED